MDTGFRRVTHDELELLRSCGPGERCLIYDNEIFKLPISTVTSLIESAFNSACADALKLAGSRIQDGEFEVEVDPIGIGQTWLRVTLTSVAG